MHRAGRARARGRLHGHRALGRPGERLRRRAPRCRDKRCFEAGMPLLGICYGMQAMGYLLGGHVVPAERARVRPRRPAGSCASEGLLDGISPRRTAGRGVDEPRRHGAAAAARLRSSGRAPTTARSRRWRTTGAGSSRVQFHPEVAHTPQGKTILRNFLTRLRRTGRLVHAVVRRAGRRRASAGRSAGTACSARSPAAWTRPWWPSLIHEPIGDQLTASSSTTACCGKGEAERRGARRSATPSR